MKKEMEEQYGFMFPEGYKKGDWLWCLHCERVFKWDGRKEDCEYNNCDGGPMDFHKWNDKKWPRSVHPEYPEIPEKDVTYTL